MSLVPQVFLFITGKLCVCGTSITPDYEENDLEEYVSFLYFPNLGKARELKLCR